MISEWSWRDNWAVILSILVLILFIWLTWLTLSMQGEPVLKSPCMMIDNLKYCRAP